MSTELTFFAKLGELNETLIRHSRAPSAISDLKGLLDDPDVRREFFRTFDRADWITPLREAGYFDDPPSAISERGVVRNPPWPAGKYLARMASYAPSDVAAIFADLQTDNVSIISDLLQAALAMPDNIAATLVPAVSRAARGGQLWQVYLTEAADLCINLANGNEVPAAMTLADALFEPRFDKGKDRSHHRDDYWYEKELAKVLPVLIALQPLEFLLKISTWLKISISATQRVDPETGIDHSHIWCPAIESDEETRDGLADILVGSVRKGFEQAVQDGAVALEEAFGILDSFHYLVFKRIKLHLLNQFAEKVPELVRQTIMNRGLFEDHEHKHEYAMLVGRRLDLLTPDERNTWFKWIDAGPEDTSHLENSTEEERRNYIRYWQFQKLHCVRAHLEGKAKDFYEEMLAKHGVPKLADRSIYFESGWGHASPMTVDELVKLSFPEAVDRVCAWRPAKHGFGEPEIEGLASTFEKYVATAPDLFAKQAPLLIHRPAIYVSPFLHQMTEAVRTGRDIEISAVLELCDWVLTRPVSERTMPCEATRPLADEGWQWTREQIAAFIKAICSANVEERPRFPLAPFRSRFWSLLSALSRDESNSHIVHDVSKDDPRVRDYLDLAINSPRGKALEGVFAYSRWVANHIKKTSEAQETIPDGFDAMPEVRDVLEWHIVPENRSVQALAVIGSQINLIYWIDKDWLAANAPRLFRLDEFAQSPGTAHGWAAWNAFLVWVPPHIEYYRLFEGQYAYAVAQCTQVDTAEQPREQPMFHLSEHLMLLYGRGQLGLDEDQGLLRRFLNGAVPNVRRHAVGFVGRSVDREEEIPKEVVDRLMALWDEYWAGAGRKDAEERPDAWLFGAWFSSGQFPEQWALKRLENFVRVVPTPQPDHGIAEQLAKTCEADIVTAVRILDRMVQGDREGWRIYGWRDQANTILKTAMSTGGNARAQAEQIINYLGRRGYTEFGTLLDVNP